MKATGKKIAELDPKVKELLVGIDAELRSCRKKQDMGLPFGGSVVRVAVLCEVLAMVERGACA